MSEQDFRNKIQWFTFLFSLIVVWVHSYNAELFLGRTGEGTALHNLEFALADTVGQIAVPGFFMISAYLFFRNFSWDKLTVKWNSRIKSILVPYIVWNAIYYSGYLIGSRLPLISEVMGKGEIPLTLSHVVDAILHYSYNYVFWYLYQLILLMILAPLIYQLIKNPYVAILYLFILTAAVWTGFELPQLNLDALLYYSAAAFGVTHARKLLEADWGWKHAALGSLVLLTGLVFRWQGQFAPQVIHIVGYRLCMPIALWLLIPEQLLPNTRRWMHCNFFLYATHFAMVRLINKSAALLCSDVLIVPWVLFLLMPFFVLIISYQAAVLLQKFTPVLWRVLNGGR